MVYPDSFDSNSNIQCTHGIHFCKNSEDLSFMLQNDYYLFTNELIMENMKKLIDKYNNESSKD